MATPSMGGVRQRCDVRADEHVNNIRISS